MSNEVLAKYRELTSTCGKRFPKVDRRLMLALLERLEQNPNKLPMFTLEVFGNEPLNKDEIRKIIWDRWKKVPQFYDNGKHVVADHEVSLELLEEISSRPEVIAIKGDPLEGASRGPSYDIH